jgi:hypothetical protein
MNIHISNWPSLSTYFMNMGAFFRFRGADAPDYLFICCFSNKESFDGRLFGHVLISWGMRLPSVFPFGINRHFAVLSKNVRMKI